MGMSEWRSDVCCADLCDGYPCATVCSFDLGDVLLCGYSWTQGSNLWRICDNGHVNGRSWLLGLGLPQVEYAFRQAQQLESIKHQEGIAVKQMSSFKTRR